MRTCSRLAHGLFFDCITSLLIPDVSLNVQYIETLYKYPSRKTPNDVPRRSWPRVHDHIYLARYITDGIRTCSLHVRQPRPYRPRVPFEPRHPILRSVQLLATPLRKYVLPAPYYTVTVPNPPRTAKPEQTFPNGTQTNRPENSRKYK